MLFNNIFSTQGKSDRINLEQFINFLNEKQRDPRLNEILYPLYDEKRALEIIMTYEQNDEARNDSEYSFTQQPVDLGVIPMSGKN